MTKSAPDSLPYRPCVGVVLFNSRRQVWIGQRADAGENRDFGTWWQMPQGGIDKGEDPATAALRELQEETSVTSARIIAECPTWLTYDLPTHLVGKVWKGRYRGQKQKWFAVDFLGSDSEINLQPDGDIKAEFNEWRWADLKEVTDLVVPFKRTVYDAVVAEFGNLTKIT